MRVATMSSRRHGLPHYSNWCPLLLFFRHPTQQAQCELPLLFLLACTECRTMAATLDCAMLLSKPNASCHPVASLGAYRGIPHPSLPSGVYRLLAFRFFFLSCIHIALKCLPSLQQAPFTGGRSCRDCCLPCPFPTSGGGWEKKLERGPLPILVLSQNGTAVSLYGGGLQPETIHGKPPATRTYLCVGLPYRPMVYDLHGPRLYIYHCFCFNCCLCRSRSAC